VLVGNSLSNYRQLAGHFYTFTNFNGCVIYARFGCVEMENSIGILGFVETVKPGEQQIAFVGRVQWENLLAENLD
jgi:hypothetical protein